MISIIIPAYNEKQNLERLIPLLTQNDHDVPFEIIIAQSNQSADNLEELDKNFKVIVLKCKNQGRAAQMNEAAGHAKGEILTFLHADVLPPQTFLSDIKKTIGTGYQAGFFSYRFDKDDKLLKINASFTAKDGIFTGGGDQCLFIKKQLFNTLGAFDEKQVLMEDFEFFDRMKKNRVAYKIINNDLVVSARKYEKNSYLRVNLSNLLLVVLFKFGYPPKKLKSLHNRLIRS